MPLVSFTSYETSPSTKVDANQRSQGDSNNNAADNATLAYGTNNSTGDTASHPSITDGRKKTVPYSSLLSVSNTTKIAAGSWDLYRITIASERTRRGLDAATMTNVAADTSISSGAFNEMRNAVYEQQTSEDEAYATDGSVTVTTYGKAARYRTSSAAAADTKITASNMNKLITDVVNSGAACTCNCNYCSCNCNYCTCNCNYSCTCNCNY